MRSFKMRYWPRRIREFNEWFDEFILAAAKPLSIAGFILGTVAVFNRQGLALQPWFVLSWSIVQAATGCKERARLAMLQYKTSGTDYTYKDLANKAQCSEASVKAYAPAIKREMGA